MNETIATPVGPTPETPKKDKKGLYIGIAVGAIVLCCCCAVVGYFGIPWLWENGDSIFGLGALIH